MSLFKKRKKCTIENWNNEYFTKIIFQDSKPLEAFDKIDLDNLKKISSGFSNCTLEKYRYEWNILKIEIICSAFCSIKRLSEYSSKQTECAKKFIINRNDFSEIWKKVEHYNQTTAKSTDLKARTMKDQNAINRINLERMSFFKKGLLNCDDEKSVAKAANRCGINTALKDFSFHYLLSFEFLDFLGIPESIFLEQSGRNKITSYTVSMIDGLIKGTTKELDNYNFI